MSGLDAAVFLHDSAGVYVCVIKMCMSDSSVLRLTKWISGVEGLPLHAQEIHGLPSRQPLKFIPHNFCLKGDKEEDILIFLSRWPKL